MTIENIVDMDTARDYLCSKCDTEKERKMVCNIINYIYYCENGDKHYPVHCLFGGVVSDEELERIASVL